MENSIHNSLLRLGEHRGGPWIKHERVDDLTSLYIAYFNSTSKESCKGSNTCNPIALRYFNKEGKEFSTFINTQFGVKRSLKRKNAIRERLWVGKNPNMICTGINKDGQITSFGIGYKEMIEPTPLFIDAVKMVKPEIIAYPISLQRNQTINTAISYNPNDMQISFLSSKATGCNYSYSPGKETTSKNTIQVHAQCKYDSNGNPQYINKLILFIDSFTQELKRIAGICSNNLKNSKKSDKNENTEGDERVNIEIERKLKQEDQSKLINMFDHDKWPLNKWAPSPFRVQHASPYKQMHAENGGELYQNSLDLSFAFGQSISNNIMVVSSQSSPFNSIYLGYNTESTNPVMLTTRLSDLNSNKKTLLMQYSSFLVPSTITYWEIPSVDGNVVYTDSICVELEQRNGNIIGIGFEGSMSSVPYDTLDENVSVIKSSSNEEGNNGLLGGKLEVLGKQNNGLIIENKINKDKCEKLAYNTPLMDFLKNLNQQNSTEAEIGSPFTVTCPNCTEIEYIKAHHIIDGPIIGLEWKCTGTNNVETVSLGGRSPSQLTTQLFNKVQPKMIELAFSVKGRKNENKSKSYEKESIIPGPAFFSIDGYASSGKIQQLLYYRMKDASLGPTITWESDEKLKHEKHVLRTVCGSLSPSQGILSLGFGFEYLPLKCSDEEVKPNMIPVDNKYTGNVPSVIVNGPRISQKVDSIHPHCSQFQGGSARTRLSNWIISFSCLDDDIKGEVPFSKLTVLRSNTNSKGFAGPIKVLSFQCPDEKTSVSVGENDSELNQMTSQSFDLSKVGSTLVVDFSPLNVVPSQVKLNPPYSSESASTKSTTLTNVSGFNEISTSSDSIYGVCFELTSDGKIAGIAFANKPFKKKKSSSNTLKKLGKIFS